MPSTIRTMVTSSDPSDVYSMPFARVPYIRMFSLKWPFFQEIFYSISATNYNDNSPYKKSVEDVSEETRYILEEFIIERAIEDGVDMSLVKPIIDVDLTARMFSIDERKYRSFNLIQFHNIDKFNKSRNDYV